MMSIKDLPAYRGRNFANRPFESLAPQTQLRVLIEALGHQHQYRNKVVSHRTCDARLSELGLCIRQLGEGGFKLRSLMGLGQRHIAHLAQRWTSEGIAAATMQTRFSHLRWLAAALGKGGLVRDPESYDVPPEQARRHLVAQQDKSWSAHGVDPAERIAVIEAIDPQVALQVRLMFEFGLRAKEAILIRPQLAHIGDYLRVEEGTKGGRTRLVPIRNESQRAAIEAAKEAARHGSRGTLIREGSSFKRAKNRLYYVCKKVGLTKRELHVTCHGLRHEYANDLYEARAGQPSAVRGGSTILDRARDLAARREVTQDLGHARLDVTASYTGPRRFAGAAGQAHSTGGDAAQATEARGAVQPS